jgi:hypothetical protein
MRLPAWALLCCLAVADGLLGCDTSCDKENEDVARDYTGGTISASCTRYETGSFDDLYLDFPPGRRLAIHHGLGQTPSVVQSYLGFVKDPLPDAGNGNTAESAGNQVIIERMDDEFVQVRNDTCEEFFLRVVIETDTAAPGCLSPVEPTDTSGGAGGASG